MPLQGRLHSAVIISTNGGGGGISRFRMCSRLVVRYVAEALPALQAQIKALTGCRIVASRGSWW